MEIDECTNNISITVPIYNVSDYLSESVNSILAQTYTGYELLLVDDGSKDNSALRCDNYAISDNRIIVVHKKNGGLSDARNTGIEFSSGRYLSFIDGDDYVSDDYLESLLYMIENYQCEMAVSNMPKVDENGKIDEGYCQPFTEKTVLSGRDRYESINRYSVCNKLFKRDIFTTIRFPKGKLYEDVYVYHYILEKTHRVGYTGRSSYFYRTRSGSIMESTYKLSSTDIIFGFYERAKYFDSIGENEIANEAYLWVYSRTAIAFSHLDNKDSRNKEKLKEIKRLYNNCAKRMINNPSYSIKQRVRCMVLCISPSIHEILYHTRELCN